MTPLPSELYLWLRTDEYLPCLKARTAVHFKRFQPRNRLMVIRLFSFFFSIKLRWQSFIAAFFPFVYKNENKNWTTPLALCFPVSYFVFSSRPTRHMAELEPQPWGGAVQPHSSDADLLQQHWRTPVWIRLLPGWRRRQLFWRNMLGLPLRLSDCWWRVPYLDQWGLRDTIPHRKRRWAMAPHFFVRAFHDRSCFSICWKQVVPALVKCAACVTRTNEVCIFTSTIWRGVGRKEGEPFS